MPGRRFTRGPLASLGVLMLAAALLGCAPARQPDPPAQSALPVGSTAAAGDPAVAALVESGGWKATVYYTAVEGYHSGQPTRVTGCATTNCTNGQADLGTYPADFVSAVHDEGSGRTSAGRYLNWSPDTGYWLDEAPRDAAGRPLRPFESAAADANVLPQGALFTIVDCGHGEGGSAVSVAVCARLRSASWTVTDEFTAGLGGANHIDLYIGEESEARFTESRWYTTLVDVRLRLS